MPDALLVDASALVDVYLSNETGHLVDERLGDADVHAPAHVDSEVMSALGRLCRAGSLSDRFVGAQMTRLSEAPIARHPLPPLLRGAWRRRHNLRLADALYVELAHQLGLTLITTDHRLAAATKLAELVSV